MKFRDRLLRELGEMAPLPKASAAAHAAAAREQLPGELIVKFAAGTSSTAVDKILARIGGRTEEAIRSQIDTDADGGLLVRVSVGAGFNVQKAIAIASKLPGVEFAEPNYVLSVDAVSNDSAYTGGQLWGMYGDQTSPANQYGSQAGEAWAAGKTGSTNVVTGVIDSGIDYTHPDLHLNIWLNQNEIPTALRPSLKDVDGDGLIGFRDLNNAQNSGFVSDLNGNGRIDAGDILRDARWENGNDQDANGYIDDLVGWDFVNNDNDPMDDNNHGTHVAGTIAGIGGNGAGVAGVTWNSQVVALKFLSASGSGSSLNAVKAVDYYTKAAQLSPNQNFVATNNSWGGGGFSQSMLDAVVRGAKQDILFVAAAGNGGPDGIGDNNDGGGYYPSSYSTKAAAGYEAVIAVASITNTGALSSFSNYGASSVDLGAPGSGIYSTVPGGGYATFSGTSMATPHVVGAIALYASLSSANAAAIAADLLGSTAATASLAGRSVTGGRLDVSNFLADIAPPPPPPPTNTVTNLYGTTGSDTINGTTGADKIWGVPASGSHSGRGTIDTLIGNGGADTFVLGDARGRFYDDGRSLRSGTSDYALVKGFGADDKLQLANGSYFQSQTNVGGASGVGIFHDSNRSGTFDSRDELIALLQGVTTPIDPAQVVFV